MQNNQQISNSEQLMILALWVGCFLSVLNITNINVALPTLIQEFQTDMTTIQWIIVVYMLANGLVMPTVGYFVDRFSGKRVYIFSMVLFTVASLLCALANNLSVMTGARLMQGVAGGLIMPVSTALIYQFIPRERQLMTSAVNSMISILGVAVGPSVSGILISFFSWQGIFIANIPISFLVIVLACKFIPYHISNNGEKLDLLGLFFASIGTISLLLGFNQGGGFGWKSPITVCLIAVGVLSMCMFIYHEMHTHFPMLNFQVFCYKGFALGVLICTILNFGSTIGPIYVAIFLQDILDYTPLQAGLAVILPSLAMAVMSAISAKGALKFGYRQIMLLGFGILMIGTWTLSQFTLTTTLLWFTICLCVRYIGLGSVTTILNNYSMSSLPKRLASHGSAMYNWIRQLIGTISVSVFSIIYSAQTVSLTEVNLSAGIINSVKLGELQAINNINFYTIFIYLVAFVITMLLNAHYMEQGIKEEV